MVPTSSWADHGVVIPEIEPLSQGTINVLKVEIPDDTTEAITTVLAMVREAKKHGIDLTDPKVVCYYHTESSYLLVAPEAEAKSVAFFAKMDDNLTLLKPEDYTVDVASSDDV